jgi:S-formylglutathione hydrolase FrmB
MHLALRYPTVFGAVVAQAGVYDFNSETFRRQALSTPFPKDWDEVEPARLVLSRLAATVPNPDNPPCLSNRFEKHILVMWNLAWLMFRR